MNKLEWLTEEFERAGPGIGQVPTIGISAISRIKDDGTGFQHRIYFVPSGEYHYKPDSELGPEKMFDRLEEAVAFAQHVEYESIISALEEELPKPEGSK